MNKRIRELWHQSVQPYTGDSWKEQSEFMERFAKLIVQDCANFVREEYDHEHAEGIAWHMEIKYGLHGDYA